MITFGKFSSRAALLAALVVMSDFQQASCVGLRADNVEENKLDDAPRMEGSGRARAAAATHTVTAPQPTVEPIHEHMKALKIE